jgi:hypothetical protein
MLGEGRVIVESDGLAQGGWIRPSTASMTDMLSAAVFPVSLAASVMRDLRSWRTSTDRVQMMRSPSQWPTSGFDVLRSVMDGGTVFNSREGLARRGLRRL